MLDSMNSQNLELNRRIYGVCIGIVTNNQDPEKLGRVKVKLPIRECTNETNWARVATPMSGKEMGCFIIPEVGDEVLVAFNDGDVHQPYVIGSLWNSTDKPPLQMAEGNHIREFKSRSGHEVIFNDESGKESLEIHTKAGQSIKMEDTGSGKVDIKDKSGNNIITIDGTNNAVTIKGNMKISLQSQSCSITIDSTQNSIVIDSPMQLKIKSQMIDIEAGANMNIKSGGMLSIKGTMVKIN